MPIELGTLPLWQLFALLAAAGSVVWHAGTRLTFLVDEVAERTGLSRAFAGMILLGGITSLPEVATAGTASAAGNPLLSINDLLGSAAINVLLLAVGDIIYGRNALTSMAAKPVTLLQGVLGMILLAAVIIAISTGDIAIPVIGTGIASLLLAIACFQALRVANRFESAETWEATNPLDTKPLMRDRPDHSNWLLGLLIALCAGAILIAGAMLALTGDAIAEKSGLGTGIVGFALVGFCTSLPELSSIMAALKLRQYELAIGDIFGTNLFNIQIIFIADLFYRGGPVIGAAGAFEIAAAALAALMTGIFVVGLIERRDRTIWRMGEDSVLAIIVFVGGLFALSRLA